MSTSTNATATTRETPLEETMEALTRAVESGKARYIGFSEWPADQIQAAIDMTGVARFVSSQPQYSLLWREPEDEVIPLCAANGISQIVWSPLGQGVLSGKYDPDSAAAADTRATSEEMGGWMDRLMRPRRAARGAAAEADRRGGRADACRSSRSPGCCASPMSPRRSSAPRGPSRCARMRRPPA